MGLLKLLPLACFLISCTSNRDGNEPKAVVDTSALQAQMNLITSDSFELIKQYPLISDTIAFIEQLKQSCQLEVHESPVLKELQKISYYKKVKLYGSEEEHILLEYDYAVGSGASFPWKYQLLFTQEGRLVKTFSALRFELLNIFPDQAPFLLTVLATSKGNGGHELYRSRADTVENVYEGYYDYNLSTYDAHEDNSIYEPNELMVKVTDINKDGFNDLVFQGKIVLIQGRTADGFWYDSLSADGKTTGYSPSNPWKKVPVEYVFLYNAATGHFKAKEDYDAKYREYRY